MNRSFDVISAGKVASILDRLRINFEERGDELWALCPMHLKRKGKLDRTASWSINVETGLNSCFSCHYKGNMYSLVRDLRGHAVAQQILGGNYPALVPEGYKVDRTFIRPVRVERTVKVFQESRLAFYTDPPMWALNQRNIDPFTASKYGVMWDHGQDAWVLPFRDPASAGLIGYQVKFHKIRRFLNYPPGLSKATTLFGYHTALDSGPDRVVVVESPLDAVLLDALGCPAVAICGSRISEEQMDLLRRFDHVGLALDNDDAGQKETRRVMGIRTGINMTPVTYVGEGKDFGEMVDVDIYKTLETAGIV